MTATTAAAMAAPVDITPVADSGTVVVVDTVSLLHTMMTTTTPVLEAVDEEWGSANRPLTISAAAGE